ncbi:MAG: succinyldiaminopimelate transaminase [Methylococcaceae bacterium]|nr:succinyldiaminopimelate transaminase [Methylococcaceae bacterium]
MNPNLTLLHPYPFEKLTQLKQGITPAIDKNHIALSIGEPKHPTPHLIQQALLTHLHGLSGYPSTKGLPELRSAIANWIIQRFQLPENGVNFDTQVLPVNGTREALFSFTQVVIDPSKKPVVIMPNPFYQIYEGAALLAGVEPYYLNTPEDNNYLPDFDSVPDEIWQRCQLLFVCSPANPTGAVIGKANYQKLINLSEQYDFVIASDECYTEIYDDEDNPPIGLLKVAYEMGNTDFKRCVMFQSLSKRSNAPGLRSGFVAGDSEILKGYFQYRTYHGSAMALPTQHASIAAWSDEAHVKENRELYRAKFTAFIDILDDVCEISKPEASFYIWLKTPFSDIDFTQQLFAQQNITVLAGSYLSRTAHGINPAKNHVRIALVAPIEECIEAAERIKSFINSL